MKKLLLILLLTIISIVLIAYTDLIIRPGYILKTAVKLPIFLFIPFVYSFFNKDFKPLTLLTPSAKGLKISFFLGIVIYIVVLTAYLIANSVADLTSIRTSLEENLGITRSNFLLIGLYVCVINSFLEEWFFRGFLFLQLIKTNRIVAYTVSSLSFAIYHIAIMDNMFPPILFCIVLLGLFIGGCIFNYLNEKNHNIYASWFCHSFANFAMNTVGFLLFYTNVM